jgi:hypothetical protein
MSWEDILKSSPYEDLLKESGFMVCTKHKFGPLDAWYKCGECVQEISSLGQDKKIVSPYIWEYWGKNSERWLNSDKGEWVNNATKNGRYVKLTQEELKDFMETDYEEWLDWYNRKYDTNFMYRHM